MAGRQARAGMPSPRPPPPVGPHTTADFLFPILPTAAPQVGVCTCGRRRVAALHSVAVMSVPQTPCPFRHNFRSHHIISTVHTGERGCEIVGPNLPTPPAGRQRCRPHCHRHHQRLLSTNQPPQVVCCLAASDSPQLVHGSPTPISTMFDIFLLFRGGVGSGCKMRG